MAGKIHGLISREDAWNMWKPYGERVQLDGSLDPDHITPFEAIQIAQGSDYDTMDSFYELSDNTDLDWTDGLRMAMADSHRRPTALLIESHTAQQRFSEEKRAKAIENNPKLISRLGRAVSMLAKEGLFTAHQVETIHSWLIGPDGQPFFQYTPMSQLEYGRWAREIDGEDPDLSVTDCTSFGAGIICNALSLQPHYRKLRKHNKVHEHVHADMSGTELYDVTHDDGLRMPQMVILGLYAAPGPATEIGAGDDVSDMENGELNEGWTDFIATELMRVDPRLAKPLGRKAGYGAWRRTAGNIRHSEPELFHTITRSALAEATPQNPTAKRAAIAEMHEYADRKLGNGVLTRMFRENGDALTDIYTKRTQGTYGNGR